MHFTRERLRDADDTPGFLQTARHHLKDALVTKVRQIGFDRLLEIEFKKEGRHYVLRVELVGKHANVRLLGNERKQLATLRKSSYIPDEDARPSVFQAKTGDDLKQFSGVSPFLAKLVEARGLAFLHAAWNPVHAPGHGAYPVSVAALGLEEVDHLSYSEAAEAHFATTQSESDSDHDRLSLMGSLRKALSSRERRLSELNKAITASENANHEQMLGELILAYGAHSIGPLIDAVDYDGNPIKISLDPNLNHVENAQRHFRRAKKARSGREDVERQISELTQELEPLQRAIAQLSEALPQDTINSVRAWATSKGFLRVQLVSQKPEDRPFEGKRVREVTGPGGVQVLYGENAEANDYLTAKLAKPDDIWLHVRGAVSAHVIIRTNRKPERIGPEALRFAAELAVRNSPSKHSGLVAVDYTLKKYVRKPRGAKPGSVIYSHEKTIDVGH